MPAGRPSKYAPKVVDEICARLACGESLRSICRDDAMVDITTVFLWLRTHEEFSHRYAQAKQAGLEAMAEEIMDIADNATNDWMERRGADGEIAGYVANGENVQRSKLRVDTRKWIMSKLAPKKYGEKVDHELSGRDGAALEFKVTFAK